MSYGAQIAVDAGRTLVVAGAALAAGWGIARGAKGRAGKRVCFARAISVVVLAVVQECLVCLTA